MYGTCLFCESTTERDFVALRPQETRCDSKRTHRTEKSFGLGGFGLNDFLLPFVEGRKASGVFSPKAMIIASVATAILVSIQTNLRIVLLLGFLIVACGVASRTRWRPVISLAARFEVLVLFWVVMVPFMYGSTVLATISLPFGRFQIYLEGLTLGFMLTLRMSLIVLLFVGTLSHMALSDFVGAMYGLRLPMPVIGSLLIMLRYVPQLVNERRVMHESQLLRGLGGAARSVQIRSVGFLIGTTIDRGFDRSTVVYDSMVLRGLGKQFRPSGTGFHRSDTLLLGVVLLLASILCGILPIPVQVF